ncbi:MAG: AmmeMemoRadiSam system radical SAM enzyme [Treponema sp.]|nr:AmmeMemoRadiSam system radical SAM enzyme [Treponema sp.]
MYNSTAGTDSSPDNETLSCDLCPHRCKIKPGKHGICGVRFNNKNNSIKAGGQIDLPYYAYITSLAEDPVEKKPLYHFKPGTHILSAGFTGCNMHCPFCQNWQISQSVGSGGRKIAIDDLVAAAKKFGQIAYTYSEPLIHAEFLLDCMSRARKAGIANVLVTNGCVNKAAAEDILNLTDAANIDLKAFSGETYSEVLGGNLEAVLEFIKTAFAKNVHVEVTTLVVPGLNDNTDELDKCADFLAGLGNGAGKSQIPWHLSAYHPDWKWNAPPTPARFLIEYAAAAEKKLDFVYTGNINNGKNDTRCPQCGRIVINRNGYSIDTSALIIKNQSGRCIYSCRHCGSVLPIKYFFSIQR